MNRASPEAGSAPAKAAAGLRLESVDALRGLVMVVMALDHARRVFHASASDPTDLATATAAVFLTRWVTHFCAPVFFFLAGAGAFVGTARGKPKGKLARFLWTRGLWLILLELTYMQCLARDFGIYFRVFEGSVLWALGWSMIALAGLIYLPLGAVSTLGMAMIVLHNLFDEVSAQMFGSLGWLWALLHSGDTCEPFPDVYFVPGYPLIPWIGVMAVGYGFGTWLLRPPEQRRSRLWWTGGLVIVAFVVLRLTNTYGDPEPWSTQKNAWFTALSFINCEKYPPSLLFLLMTLGPALAALAWFDRPATWFTRPLLVYGRVPLFFYLVHYPLIHVLAVALAHARLGVASWSGAGAGPDSLPEGHEGGLPRVYVLWLTVVLLLYPVCRWFAKVKQSRRSAWLSYL